MSFLCSQKVGKLIQIFELKNTRKWLKLSSFSISTSKIYKKKILIIYLGLYVFRSCIACLSRIILSALTFLANHTSFMHHSYHAIIKRINNGILSEFVRNIFFEEVL